MTSKLTLNLRADPNENYNVLTTAISKPIKKINANQISQIQQEFFF